MSDEETEKRLCSSRETVRCVLRSLISDSRDQFLKTGIASQEI